MFLRSVWRGVLFSAAGWAQQSPSGIAGVVKDTSGGVLPGVTVEAASPALIEKVRTVVTDGEGRYNIVDLRPGTYTVTFTLPGFSTFKREGITLTAGFTATVNADMQVGALEETITVTGAAPLVDTQNARQQKVMSADLMTALPTGSASVYDVIALTPGMTGNATVGGSTGAYHSQQLKGTFHGKKGSHVQFDGMRIDNYAGSGDSAGYLFNNQTVEETALETGGAGAAHGSPTSSMNMIPKEGGNTFRYSVTGLFEPHLQSDNLNDELVARGLTSRCRRSTGCRRRRDDRRPDQAGQAVVLHGDSAVGHEEQVDRPLLEQDAGHAVLHSPDLDRPAFRDESIQSHAARITWQAVQEQAELLRRHQERLHLQIRRRRHGARARAVKRAGRRARAKLWPNGIVQGTWSAPITSKLLLEAGADCVMFHWPGDVPGAGREPRRRLDPGAVDQLPVRAPATLTPVRQEDRYSQRFLCLLPARTCSK